MLERFTREGGTPAKAPCSLRRLIGNTSRKEDVAARLVVVDYKRISQMANRGGAPDNVVSAAAVPPVTRVRMKDGIKQPSIELSS